MELAKTLDGFEVLEFDEEIEEIQKALCAVALKFPAITVTEKMMYFNRLAIPIVPKYIRWGATTNYIVGLPGKENDRNAYKPRRYRGYEYLGASFPSELKNEKKLKPGYYKLYRYKDGFAFKRYETMTYEEAKNV